MGWREVRDVFQRVDHEASVFHLRSTFRALAQMGPQGIHPEAHLIIDEEVDLVWEQVSMVHWVSGNTYGVHPELVSRRLRRRWNGAGGQGRRWKRPSAAVERWNGGRRTAVGLSSRAKRGI
jgi:hypothetical protein